MTFVATPGSDTANSFLTVSQAIAFLVGRPGAEAFVSELQLHLQEAWLIQATGILVRRVGWFDLPANPLALVEPLVQALPLPMVGQVDAFGRLLATTLIPPLAQEATALYALALAQEGATSLAGLAALQHLKIGNVEVRVRETTTVSPRQRIPAEVWDLLRLYGRIPFAGRHMAVVRGQG